MTWVFRQLERFFDGGAFPVFTLTLLGCWEAVLVTLWLMPASDSGLGAFAADFRVWCYGGTPGVGGVQWAYLLAMLLPPLMVGSFIVLMWWGPLQTALRDRRTLLRVVGPTVALVVLMVGGLGAIQVEPATGELPFPAQALRTGFAPPAIALTDHRGAQVSLDDLRGEVVLITAVYAHCVHTCPAIIAQTKGALATLPEGLRPQVLAITLDPDNDSVEVLASLAKQHSLGDNWHLLTGDAGRVNGVLDLVGVARTRDPNTGVIDHTNVFMLVDRGGKVAYRFSLGARQQDWLSSALALLLAEDRP